jgi:hypothetical protein
MCYEKVVQFASRIRTSSFGIRDGHVVTGIPTESLFSTVTFVTAIAFVTTVTIITWYQNYSLINLILLWLCKI